MKRTCNGCKALSIWTYGHNCWLGFKQVIRNYDVSPAEDCPKPKTYAEYDKALQIIKSVAP